jgi:hypothetical protein
MIQKMSPVAWQHINLIGHFELSAADSKVDIEALIERYAHPDGWSKLFQPETEAILANFTFLARWARIAVFPQPVGGCAFWIVSCKGINQKLLPNWAE